MYKIVARPVGYVYLGLAGMMLLCTLFGVASDLSGFSRPYVDEGGTLAMAVSTLLAAVIAVVVARLGRDAPIRQMRRGEATVTVCAIWAGTGVLGALPFAFDSGLPLWDGIFEAVSGFTTTGATILTDIEGQSRTLLLWRSLMQWLGGMGIVVLFVAVFPSLGVSGKHMFRSEVPGPTAEGLQPRIRETSFVLWKLYTAFTLLQTLILTLQFRFLVPATENLTWAECVYEALCHSMTTMSTGGFSTRDASIAAFDSGLVDYTLSIFMILAGVNFGLYYGLLATRRLSVFSRSIEFRAYAGIVAVVTVLLTIAIVPNHEGNWFESLRYAFFMVATTITSTGYGTDDYMAYPSTGLILVLLMMFVGGSAGSTAGGIKVSRIVLLIETTAAQVRRSVRPSVIQVVRMGRQVMHDSTLTEVAVFFFIYMSSMLVGVVFVAYTDGVPLPTAFGANLTSLSNMGPGPFYQGSDNFAGYTPVAKLWFSLAMILGRLEFFTVLALLVPDTWRR